MNATNMTGLIRTLPPNSIRSTTLNISFVLAPTILIGALCSLCHYDQQVALDLQ